MKRVLLATLCLPALMGAHAGTIRMTTQSEPGTSVRILLNAKSATSPVTIDWGNGVEVKYTVNPAQAAYNRWIEGTIEGPNMSISGNVTEADLNELGLTKVEIEGMSYLTDLNLSKNDIASFELLSVTPLEEVNLSHNNLWNNTYEHRTLSLEYAGETLRNLNVSHNPELLCLDIRDLTVLEYLTANDCQTLGSVFICLPEDSRAALRNINLSNCDLAHFYPVNLPSMTSLNLANNQLMTSADDEPFVLGNYPALSTLDVSNNRGIDNLDVTGCTKLSNLNIAGNRIERIDLSQAPELEVLYAAGNKISTLDLGNNPLLRTLDISGNPVKELDVTQFDGMRILKISDTQISRVMLMQASYLEEFHAANTLLEFVDFNGQQAQRMKIIDLRNNPRMTGQTVDYTIHTLPQAKSSAGNNLLLSGSNAETAETAYATSLDMGWKCDVTGDGSATHSNVPVNLVGATDTGENKTGTVDRLYPIFGLSMDYDFDIYQTEGGKFLISQWQPSYFQTMLSVTDKALTGVPIHVYPYPEEGKRFKSVTVNGKEITDRWFVIDGEADIKVNFANAESSLSFTSTPGNPISMLVNTNENNGTVWVDWGTGTRNEYTGQNKYQSGYAELKGTRIDGTAAGNGTVTVYGDIAAIDLSGFGEYGLDMGLWDNKVSDIDITNASGLRYLNLYWNPVTSLNLAGATSLEVLNTGYTAIQTLDLSDATGLMYLSSRSDGFGDPDDGIAMLSAIDVTALEFLQYLDLKGNALTSIDLSGNPYLYYFDANGNNLTSIDLSANTAIENLNLGRNKLSAIDLSKQPALIYLSLSGNNLSSLDLSANAEVTELHVDNNDIHALDLRHLEGLRRLYINGNGMTADELNDIYYLLPQREHGVDDDNPNQVKWNIAVIQGGDRVQNEGTRADSSIAEDRGWTPSHLGSNGGSDKAYLDILPSVHGSVKVTGEDGTEYAHGSKVPKYSKLTITATPEEGYVMTSYSLNDEEPVAATKFDMPGIYTKLRVNFSKDSGVEGVNGDTDTLSTVETSSEGVVVTSPAATIDIFSTDGRQAVSAADVNGVRVFHLPAGIYVVRVADAAATQAVKVIVK